MTISKTVQTITSKCCFLKKDGSKDEKSAWENATVRVIEGNYDIKGAAKAFMALPIRKLSFGTLKEVAKSFYSEKVTEYKKI